MNQSLHHYLYGWHVPGTASLGMCTYEQPGHTWYHVMNNTWYQVRVAIVYQGAPSKKGYRVPGVPNKSGDRVLGEPK